MNPILRRGMLGGMALYVAMYRASRGRFGGAVRGTPVLLLTVPGRKSGAAHTRPTGYLLDARRWIVTGTNGGAAAEPQWFRNLRATNDAVIEIGGVTTNVSVRIPVAEERDALWQKFIAANPSYAGYEKKSARQIPVAVLTERDTGSR